MACVYCNNPLCLGDHTEAANLEKTENETIKAHHLPIRIKNLEAQVAALTAERNSLRETLRDRFAMATLTGAMGNSSIDLNIMGENALAGMSYLMADAMLEARQK